jgi:uncharacterized protein
MTEVASRLEAVLDELLPAVVAVSGGVDSLTLMACAHRRAPGRARAVHAASAAVPRAARDRIEHLARQEGWPLDIIDAGELGDPAYRSNPLDRCFHCKSHLYGALAAIARSGEATVVSGANVDDLTDFRPGLEAAQRHGVRHPYIEAGLGKREVRALARALDLPDVAELPASPCLSSRVETGIAIEAPVLLAIDQAEALVRQAVPHGAVRCRVRQGAVELELDDVTALAPEAAQELAERAGRILASAGVSHPVQLAPYRRGSAFLHRERAT